MKARLTLTAATIAMLMAGGAWADTIRATSGFGPAHVLATDIYPEINARLSEFTGGAWDLNDTPSGLVAPNEMSAGLRDGVTEMGTLLLPYFPADYPEAALPAELAFLGSSNAVSSSAVTEYVATCTECQAEFARNGQVYLGSDATPVYNLLTTKPIRSAADMRGTRIRTGAPLYAAFVEKMGGVAVQMPSSELFESLSQGVIDGTFSGTHEIIANRLGDVVKYVTEVEQGMFNSSAPGGVSAMLWDRMSAEDRQALARATQYGIAKGLAAFMRDAEAAREVAGLEFIPADETLKTAQEQFNAEYLANVAATLESRGVTDAQAKVDRYKALIEKWEGLIQPGMTPEQIGQLRYDEIFAKLDLATYGQ
ncbi:MAG: C4-dicarboxylate TRAP transporter substrate-binding protein [Paracoccus sp. (in: a-proteobacteria)]|uniref:C4-dicarboxylate TRAP transporter substrate-binding protein n=1 Tax=Paracoccus sp. TaxID=267 RepID=UPI0026E04E6C|nr:C4-dicarboxylate TRAP transporter substrate-binding protein [Paracoccus sp. (in: a-proteobacteria)]MDO5620337.1 C4-dicarboxylate TRAP transporter substrate-binding protein [Paracoccus sp. (in: a-proteobacteria)]